MDVGCGVASFGGYLLDKSVLTMSFAPKDEHEAQIQFALERGIPAFLAVIGTQKLTFPDNVFDMIHCARCRVHWDADGWLDLFIMPDYASFCSSITLYKCFLSKCRWNAIVGTQ